MCFDFEKTQVPYVSEYNPDGPLRRPLWEEKCNKAHQKEMETLKIMLIGIVSFILFCGLSEFLIHFEIIKK
jgi:hypothetical protein